MNLLATQAEGVSPSKYFEVDFPDVTKKKAAIIANREPLHRLLGPNLDPQGISKPHPTFAAVFLSTPAGAFCVSCMTLLLFVVCCGKTHLCA